MGILGEPWKQVGFLRDGLGRMGEWAGFSRQRQEASPSLSKHQSSHTESCPHLTLHTGEKGLSTWQGKNDTTEPWCGRWEAWSLVLSPELTWVHHHFTSSHLQNGGSQPLCGPQSLLLSSGGVKGPGWS